MVLSLNGMSGSNLRDTSFLSLTLCIKKRWFKGAAAITGEQWEDEKRITWSQAWTTWTQMETVLHHDE